MRLRKALTSLAALPMSCLAVAAGIGALSVERDMPEVELVDHVQPTDSEGLDPVLELAYTFAERDAEAAGVPLAITSGHRTWAEQQALWQYGIAEYGSPQAARAWVLPPSESAHVAGKAIDVRPREGALWLERNGNRYGLCRTYENEWWHFEFATLPFQPCPAMVRNASVPLQPPAWGSS